MIVMLQAQQGFDMKFLLMIVLMFAIMWFFMIRPQQKKQKEIQNFRNAIQPGTDVVTAGGIYGRVKEVVEAENALIIEIARDVKIKVDRNSVYATAPSETR